MCPSCRDESSKTIKLTMVIDHMESDIFDQVSVALGVFSSRILAKKRLIWVDKTVDVKSSDSHELTILLWLL